MSDFSSRAEGASLHVHGASPIIEYNLRAKTALQNLPFPHRRSVQEAVQNLGQAEEGLREIDEERSIWRLEAPPRYYVYLRIRGSRVTVLDVIPRSRLREMGFESQSDSSPPDRKEP